MLKTSRSLTQFKKTNIVNHKSGPRLGIVLVGGGFGRDVVKSGAGWSIGVGLCKPPTTSLPRGDATAILAPDKCPRMTRDEHFHKKT